MQNIFVFSLLLPGEKCCCGPGTASSIHGCLLDYWECSLECPRFSWQANPPPSNPRILLHSSVSPSAAPGDRAAGDAVLMKEWLCEVQGWCLHSRAGHTLLLETAFHPSSIPVCVPTSTADFQRCVSPLRAGVAEEITAPVSQTTKRSPLLPGSQNKQKFSFNPALAKCHSAVGNSSSFSGSPDQNSLLPRK